MRALKRVTSYRNDDPNEPQVIYRQVKKHCSNMNSKYITEVLSKRVVDYPILNRLPNHPLDLIQQTLASHLTTIGAILTTNCI